MTDRRDGMNGRAPAQAERHDLESIVSALVASYRSDARGHHIGRRFFPSRDEIIEVVEILLQLMYPGYFGRQGLTEENVVFHVGALLSTAREKLARQVSLCLAYAGECGAAQAQPPCGDGKERPPLGEAKEQPPCEDCDAAAARLTAAFLSRLPEVRATLMTDVQAAYDGDPAATNLDEIVLAYPGLLAITVYRLAHELHELGVALMPRIMTEWAHAKTGADIHPGAVIGRGFFLDHATGAVVGETTRIGQGVKLYQGVTLGALSHPKDERGRIIRGEKRHPTVEDGVTVYANATVLGGATTLGGGSVIGGSVFITRSVPPGSRVALKPPELRVKASSDAPPDEEPIEVGE